MQAEGETLLRRSSRVRQHKDLVANAMNHVENERPKDFGQNVDVLDTKLFEYDYGRWYAKAMVMYTIAKTMQNEHQGHACTNPQAVLDHIEARYWKKPGGKTRGNGTSCCPEIETFNRINDARVTQNEKKLRTYLDQLSTIIRLHCQDLRDEDEAELDASDSTESTTSNMSSMNVNLSVTDTFEHAGSSSQDEVDYSTDASSRNSSPVSRPSKEELSMHEYTSTVWEFAAQTGREPTYKKGPSSSKVKSWEASLGDVRVEGKARNYKVAKHIASRKLCHALGIC